MRTAFLAALILLSVCLTGCTRCINYETRVITEPPGVKIEVNNDYIGTSPCTVTFCGRRGRLFRGLCTINALPLEPGQWVQRKFFYDRAPIPKVVYFDMKLTPANPDVNINLNQRTVR
jgi:hypothetical protein